MSKEAVHHPAHYGGKNNPHETIKVLKAWLSPEAYIGFLRGNAIKYLSRAGKKVQTPEGRLEDLMKARFYIDAEIQQVKDDVHSGSRRPQ